MTFKLFPYKYKKISGILYTMSLFALTTLFLIEHLNEDLGRDIVFFFNGPIKSIIKPSIFFHLFLDEAFMAIVVCAGLFFAFSQEKNENEAIGGLRYKSLIWSFIINYMLLFVLYSIIYSVAAYTVVTAFILSQLFIFIIHYRISVYRYNKKL